MKELEENLFIPDLSWSVWLCVNKLTVKGIVKHLSGREMRSGTFQEMIMVTTFSLGIQLKLSEKKVIVPF